MFIETRKVRDLPVLDIEGNIKTSEDYETFKSNIDKLVEAENYKIILNFQSYSTYVPRHLKTRSGFGINFSNSEKHIYIHNSRDIST